MVLCLFERRAAVLAGSRARRPLSKSLCALLLVGSGFSAGCPAFADQLADFTGQCDRATGVTVPDFDCDAGTEVPGQGQIFTGNTPGTCDEPNRLNGWCDPGSRFQVLVRTGDAFVVAHCRKEEGGAGLYGDIAVIQHNRKNGATCFYQALGNQHHGNLPGGHTAPNAPPKPVKAPSNGAAPNTLWMTPASTASIGCAGCHDNGAIIRSPYLNLVTGPNELPGARDFSFNKNDPYAFIGDAFSSWKSYKVEIAGNECNNCHRMGVNDISPPHGTALDFGIRATSASEQSKNPPSLNSPIWMPPVPVQTSVDPQHVAAAQAIRECALRFHETPLPNSDKCRITLFAQAFMAGPPPPASAPPSLSGVYYLLFNSRSEPPPLQGVYYLLSHP
jgi:hypothetical protein